MSRLILIRPGCTDFDENERIQGALDLPLNQRGEEQVACLIKSLANVELDLIYASSTEPARGTALRLGESRGVPVKVIEELANVNHGLWQGLQRDDVRRKHPKVYRQWQDSPESICPPGGETLAEAASRVRKLLQKPLKRKGSLAIVACEPLASIIAEVVNGSRKPAEGSACDASACGTWEVLRESGPGASGTDVVAAAQPPRLGAAVP